MYLKNSNFAIYLGLAALVGFGVSFLFGAGNLQGDLLSGDISKASRYNKQRVDPETTIIEEKLQNDKEFFNQTKAAMDYLKERTATLTALTDETIRVCSDIPELQGSLSGITSLSAKAYNTNLAFEQATAGLDKIASGNKAPEYEQASNDALAGFRKIENQLNVSKDFVEAAGSYAEKNANSELAAIVAIWTSYCAQEAFMNESKEDLAYWGEKCAEISSSMMGNQEFRLNDLSLKKYLPSDFNALGQLCLETSKTSNAFNAVLELQKNFSGTAFGLQTLKGPNGEKDFISNSNLMKAASSSTAFQATSTPQKAGDPTPAL